MEAQLAEAMAMMQEHPELNTPENRQILHKLRYSIQGGGENDIRVTATDMGTGDTKTRVLSVTPNGKLALDDIILTQFKHMQGEHVRVEDEDAADMDDIPKDNAFFLPSKFALLVLTRLNVFVSWGPEDIKKLGGMPDDEHLQKLITNGDIISEFKKIAASDEDLDSDEGEVGGTLSNNDYRYGYVHLRLDNLYENEAEFVRKIFDVKTLPSPAFAL